MYLLHYPLKGQSYLVAPRKQSYLPLDPAKTRELLGQQQSRLDGPAVTIEHREFLGTATVDGHPCDKVRLVALFANKSSAEVIAWLARDLQHFPLKIDTDYYTRGGISANSSTEFKNVRSTAPAEALFVIPKGYRRCTTLLELASGAHSPDVKTGKTKR